MGLGRRATWWLHRKLGRHKIFMRKARSNARYGIYLRDLGKPVKGWEHVSEAIAAAVACGCPEEMWPDELKRLLP